MSFIAVGVGGATAAAVGGITSAAGNIAGSAIQAGAAQSAAERQAQSAEEANRIQREMYEQQRADLSPYREAGASALSQLADPNLAQQFQYKDFQFKEDPGYQFRLQEGQKAIERAASAGGRVGGGRFAKEMARYGSGLASQEYGAAHQRYGQDYSRAFNTFNTAQQRRLSQLGSIAGMGQGAASNTAAAAGRYGSAAAENVIGAGNAAAASGVAQGNVWGQTASNLGNVAGEGAAMLF